MGGELRLLVQRKFMAFARMPQNVCRLWKNQSCRINDNPTTIQTKHNSKRAKQATGPGDFQHGRPRVAAAFAHANLGLQDFGLQVLGVAECQDEIITSVHIQIILATAKTKIIWLSCRHAFVVWLVSRRHRKKVLPRIQPKPRQILNRLLG